MKARRKTNILIISISIFLAQCSNKQYSKEEYVKFVANEENGLNISQSIDGVKYNIQYLPTKMMVLLEDNEIYSDSIEIKQKEYEELEYFKLIIEADNTESKKRFSFLTSPSEYNKLLQYTNTEFNKTIELNVESQSLPCVMSYAEPGYKISAKLIFILAFNKPSIKGDYKISFKDGIFGNGIIKFLIEKKDIEKLDIIKII